MYRIEIVGFFLVWCLASCTKDNASSISCPACVTISFRADIIPVLTSQCAKSGCHTGSANTAPGRISLDSTIAYAQVTLPGKGYVNAGNPNSSILYSQLLSGSINHMPVGGQLDPCTIQKIYCWIQQGALDN
jgi:hypothetical protein